MHGKLFDDFEHPRWRPFRQRLRFMEYAGFFAACRKFAIALA
jgi:hypothetical protein